MITGKILTAVLAATVMAISLSACSGGEKGMVSNAMKEACSSLPSDLRISGPNSSQEFVDNNRTIYVAEGGGQYMYWDILDSSEGRLSMTTAYAGDENVAMAWGCPTNIVTGG